MIEDKTRSNIVAEFNSRIRERSIGGGSSRYVEVYKTRSDTRVL